MFIADILIFISRLLTLYLYILLAAAIFSWLYAFGVVNARNQAVSVIGRFLYVVTEPVLRPVRGVLNRMFGGNTGGIDFSVLVVALLILFVQQVIIPALIRLVLGL